TKGRHAELQGYIAATLIITTGALVSRRVIDLNLQHVDTTADGHVTPVCPTGLLGTLPSAQAARTGCKQGRNVANRYIRAVITKPSGTSIAAGAVFALGHPRDAPVA